MTFCTYKKRFILYLVKCICVGGVLVSAGTKGTRDTEGCEQPSMGLETELGFWMRNKHCQKEKVTSPASLLSFKILLVITGL